MKCRLLHAVTVGAVLITVGGCASIESPASDLAARHVGSPAQFVEAGADGLSGAISAGWLSAFDDPQLEALVREAWAHNPDLYVAASRFEEATASLRVAASYLYPQVTGAANGSYTNYDGSRDQDAYSASLRVAWEVDLWGRLRSDREAARAAGRAAGLDYVQARHSLAAAVAESYYAVIAAEQQLTIDRLLLDAEQFTAETTRQRVEVGLLTTLEQDVAESNVRLAEAAVENDLAALRSARRALEVLVGRYPAADIAAAAQALPAIESGTVPVGIPSELLERRPDVRRAEALVDAAYYDVRSARAARLPSLTLTADVTQMLDPSEFVSSVAGEILAPIFQGGRLKAREMEADARQRQTLGEFASIALRAFSEVENALSNERYLESRERSLSAARDRLVEASDAASNRYEQGLLTILDLQQVRRSDFSTRSSLLGVRYERIRQRINLHLALGGPVLAGDRHGINASIGEPDPRSIDPAEASVSGQLHVGIARGVEEPRQETETDDGG